MSFADKTTRDMVLILTALLSHRALRGRRDQLKLPLRPDEQRRMVELERVFGAGDSLHSGEPGLPARPTYLTRAEGRAPVRLPIEFRVDSGDWSDGSLSNLSSSGCFVETRSPRRIGEHVVLRFLDLAAGRAWQFAAEVERLEGGDHGGMGLRFSGIPLELRLGGAPNRRRHSIAA